MVSWTEGIKSSQLATCTGLSHRSIKFRSVVFLLQLKMWFTPCSATSHLGERLSTLLQIPLKIRALQWAVSSSVVLVGYVQFVAAFVFLPSLVEVSLVACFLCSTEYGPCVGGCL